MSQVYAIVDGVAYTGRSAGVGMIRQHQAVEAGIFKGKRIAK
jgi:hypothetical protein